MPARPGRADFDDFPESGWDKVMNLNLKAPFFLTQALLAPLKAAATPEKPGKIINIASIDGIFVNPLETYSYAASKAGLIHLTRRMAARFAPLHIDRHGDRARTIRFGHEPRCARPRRCRCAPGPGRDGSAADDDMAGAAIFLASRAGDYVVGATLSGRRRRRVRPRRH